MTLTEAKNEIPRIIHFIWLGSETPPAVSLRIEKFTSLNPNWQVILWRDGDLDWLINKREFETGSTWQAKANIARYEILLRHGGYYFDTDFDPQQSLDPIRSLVGSRPLVFCRECEGVINNAFLGSVPSSPFLADLISELPPRVKTFPNSISQFATGPEFLTQHALK